MFFYMLGKKSEATLWKKVIFYASSYHEVMCIHHSDGKLSLWLSVLLEESWCASSVQLLHGKPQRSQALPVTLFPIHICTGWNRLAVWWAHLEQIFHLCSEGSREPYGPLLAFCQKTLQSWASLQGGCYMGIAGSGSSSWHRSRAESFLSGVDPVTWMNSSSSYSVPHIWSPVRYVVLRLYSS